MAFCCFIPLIVQSQCQVTTYAGSGANGFANGDTLTASFGGPSDILRDHLGNLIVVDQNSTIRKITPSGVVTILAGTGSAGYLDGPGDTARFNSPISGCVDSIGNVYISDFQNHRIRKIDTNGNVTTIAGNGVAGYKDTTALEASFNYPRGICVDRQGNFYIADCWNHRIRKMDANGNVTTFAGGGTSTGVQSPGALVDGNDTTARFWTPCGLEIDGADTIYVADAYNHRIRKITPQGVVSTVAGSGPGGSANGAYMDGPATIASFDTPIGMSLDNAGGIYVADLENYRLRYIHAGMVTTVAGDGFAGYVDGPCLTAEFNRLRDVVGDATGNFLYVTDAMNHRIRKLTLNTGVGTSPAANSRSYSIFPNPASTFLRMAAPGQDLQEVNIEVYDLRGQVVGAYTLAASDAVLDVQALAAGMYVIRLAVDGEEQWIRFVKE